MGLSVQRCLPGGVVCQTSPFETESQTNVKTLPCHNYVVDSNNHSRFGH